MQTGASPTHSRSVSWATDLQLESWISHPLIEVKFSARSNGFGLRGPSGVGCFVQSADDLCLIQRLGGVSVLRVAATDTVWGQNGCEKRGRGFFVNNLGQGEKGFGHPCGDVGGLCWWVVRCKQSSPAAPGVVCTSPPFSSTVHGDTVAAAVMW